MLLLFSIIPPPVLPSSLPAPLSLLLPHTLLFPPCFSSSSASYSFSSYFFLILSLHISLFSLPSSFSSFFFSYSTSSLSSYSSSSSSSYSHVASPCLLSPLLLSLVVIFFLILFLHFSTFFVFFVLHLIFFLLLLLCDCFPHSLRLLRVLLCVSLFIGTACYNSRSIEVRNSRKQQEKESSAVTVAPTGDVTSASNAENHTVEARSSLACPLTAEDERENCVIHITFDIYIISKYIAY